MARKSKLTRKQRGQLEDRFLKSMETVAPLDRAFVLREAPKKLATLEASPEAWMRDLADGASTLLQMLTAISQGTFTATRDSERAMIVAMQYLIEPFDLVPDIIPARGYGDDAYILDLCRSFIHADLNRFTEQHRKATP